METVPQPPEIQENQPKMTAELLPLISASITQILENLASGSGKNGEGYQPWPEKQVKESVALLTNFLTVRIGLNRLSQNKGEVVEDRMKIEDLQKIDRELSAVNDGKPVDQNTLIEIESVFA